MRRDTELKELRTLFIKMPILRLDKFLTAVGAGSRSEVKNYIKAGKVSVDGNIVKKQIQRLIQL